VDERLGEDRSPVRPRKRRWSVYVMVAAVVVIVIVLVAFAATPPLNGLVSKAYVHDGDFIDYNVSGTALFFPIAGGLRIDVSNVTVDGFTATVNATDVPGFDSATYNFTWEDDVWAFIDIGSKVSSANISTPWGVKQVDMYYNQNGTDYYTTYIGTDPQVVYQMEVTGTMYQMTITMTNTSIDIVKIGNQR
jgi:hypothetical protein